MGELFDFATTLILEDRMDEAEECLLAESIESEILQKIGEVSVLDYLMKIEKFLDERDLYLYDGWEDAQIISSPKVDKFWVTLDLKVPKTVELKGVLRCCQAENETQNTTKYKQLEDGSYFVRLKILRRILDKIEMAAKDRAEEIANNESEV